jgi:hypothetical protein
MKREEWNFLAKAMWEFADRHEGRISSLLKQLILEIHNNKEMIEDDMGEYEQTTGSDRPSNTNTTGN